MAERRMFSKRIIDSDAFLDMPLSTQALYFHLSMRADDDGFVSNPRRIRTMVGASEDDLKLLIAKRFLLTFESGVVVIKHWRIHNYINPDRYTPTTYVEEKATLALDDKKAYTECLQNVVPVVVHDVVQSGDKMCTQVRLGKVIDRKGKDKENIEGGQAAPRSKFLKPSVEEIAAYCSERDNGIDPQQFFDFYESKGWKVGNQSMKDWKAAVRTWERREKPKKILPKETPSKYNREE